MWPRGERGRSLAKIRAQGIWPVHTHLGECRDVIKMSVGPLLWRLSSNMDRAAAAAVAAAAGGQPQQASAGGSSSGSGGGGVDPRFYVYSGHDSTVTPLLAALGKREARWVGRQVGVGSGFKGWPMREFM